MKDLGTAKQILGMKITKDMDVLKLTQEDYVKKVLNRFKMDEYKPVSTLLVSYFKLSNEQLPSIEQERAYMVDVSYALLLEVLWDIDGRKSTTGYVYTFGNTVVSWVSKLQKIVALSTIKLELKYCYLVDEEIKNGCFGSNIKQSKDQMDKDCFVLEVVA
ncbi:Retrovirus-related Pol polyprotein from transposon TNT 1-94 [Abeliophyllum distichum]|uniref:Retrovirus-related Pol polyprotein from transposon TNT 1-94 n=1 Tax=Abeliophyllum distichum TaxID=126358 RepID=A0ABD1U1B4_9LAMI